jgi:hypothetical protein
MSGWIMVKDIIVNLGLGLHDPAGDFTISLVESFDAHVLGVAFAYGSRCLRVRFVKSYGEE